jgi:hypothetical protein
MHGRACRAQLEISSLWIAMRGRLRCLNWRSINGHHARHPEVLGEPVLRPNCHVRVENNMVKAIAANKPRRRFSPPRESEEGSSVYSSIFIRFLAYRESGRIWAYGRLSAGYLIGAMRARTQAGWSGCGPNFGFNPAARMRRCKLERLLLRPHLIQLFPKPAQQFSQTDTYRAILPSSLPSKPLSAPRRPSS